MRLVTDRTEFQFNFHPKGQRFQYMSLPDLPMVNVTSDKKMVEEGLRLPKLPKLQRQWFENRDKKKLKQLKEENKLLTKQEVHQAFIKHAKTLVNWGLGSKIILNA